MSAIVPIPPEMATPEGLAALAASEKRGYQRGYAAKVRRAEREDAQERSQREKQIFRREVFLAVLPKAFEAQGWKNGDKPITGMRQRVALAWDFADEAMRRYY